MAIETALAKGSLDRVSRRDPEKLYHKMTCRSSTRWLRLSWPGFFKGSDAPPFQTLTWTVPEFIKSMNAAIQPTALDDLRHISPGISCTTRRMLLPLRFEQETFNFFGKTLAGSQGNAPALEALRRSDRQRAAAKRSGSKYVETTLRREGKQRTLKMVDEIEKAMDDDIKRSTG